MTVSSASFHRRSAAQLITMKQTEYCDIYTFGKLRKAALPTVNSKIAVGGQSPGIRYEFLIPLFAVHRATAAPCLEVKGRRKNSVFCNLFAELVCVVE